MCPDKCVGWVIQNSTKAGPVKVFLIRQLSLLLIISLILATETVVCLGIPSYTWNYDL